MNQLIYTKCLTAEETVYDVVVVGGGSAGICAAIAAANNGASTLLIENTGWLGGIGTTAGMVEFGPIQRGGICVLGGIPYALMQQMQKNGGAQLKDKTQGLYFPPESFAHTALEMCEQAGVHLLLHARFVDSIIEEKRIKAVLVDTKEGLKVITAQMFIDCTGDGDVFFKAGAPYHLGRAEDGGTQPMTLVFFVNNVNYALFLATVKKETGGDPDPYFVQLVAKARQDGKFHIPITRPGSTGPVPRWGRAYTLDCCEVFINGTNVVGKCGVNAQDLTLAEVTARKQIHEMHQFLKEYVPGFEQCYISYVPSEIGVRETRRLQGCYTLTKEDLLQCRQFEDRIAIGFNMIDIHQVVGEDFDLTHLKAGAYYTIPYRCLVCDAYENLFTAGRCISTTHEALGAIRVMVNTMPVGQAAGSAAALAAKTNCTTQTVNVQTLQQILRQDDAVLEPTI